MSIKEDGVGCQQPAAASYSVLNWYEMQLKVLKRFSWLGVSFQSVRKRLTLSHEEMRSILWSFADEEIKGFLDENPIQTQKRFAVQ